MDTINKNQQEQKTQSKNQQIKSTEKIKKKKQQKQKHRNNQQQERQQQDHHDHHSEHQHQQNEHSELVRYNSLSKLSIITQPEILYETTHALADKAASTFIGQYAIIKIDKILSIIEKTAKWSLPQSGHATNATTDKITSSTMSSTALDRPLPWIPFLATIMALRALRISLSFASILIGNEPISASEMVYFIQTRRRKLRYIKNSGLRQIREKQQQKQQQRFQGIINNLSSLLGGLVFSKIDNGRKNDIGGGSDDGENSNDRQNAANTYFEITSKNNKNSHDDKHKEKINLLALLNSSEFQNEQNDLDATLNDLLNKSYSEDDDENDLDFILNENDESDADDDDDDDDDDNDDGDEDEDEDEDNNRNNNNDNDIDITKEITKCNFGTKLEKVEEDLNECRQEIEAIKEKKKNSFDKEEKAKNNENDNVMEKNQNDGINDELKSRYNEKIALSYTPTELNQTNLKHFINQTQDQQQQQSQLEQDQKQKDVNEHIALNNNNNTTNNNNNHHHEFSDNPSSISINPPKLSPQIARYNNSSSSNNNNIDATITTGINNNNNNNNDNFYLQRNESKEHKDASSKVLKSKTSGNHNLSSSTSKSKLSHHYHHSYKM